MFSLLFVIPDQSGHLLDMMFLGIKHFVLLQAEESLMPNGTNFSIKKSVWLQIKVESFLLTVNLL
jgi:hypothetical protein